MFTLIIAPPPELTNGLIALIRVASTMVNDNCKCWVKLQCNSTQLRLLRRLFVCLTILT